MFRILMALGVLASPHEGGWLFRDGGPFQKERARPKISDAFKERLQEAWEQAHETVDDWASWAQAWSSEFSPTAWFPDSEGTVGWEFSIWMLLDTVVGLVGWMLFGSAWGNVKVGMKRILQVGIVMMLCIVAHYIWAVCYPVVSILLALIMAVVWACKKVLKIVGTMVFYSQKWAGGAPEAADAEFHGPGTGVIPETAILRTFKRSGDNPKLVVVKRGTEVVVFQVGWDSVTIRTHGLYLPVEPDTVRGSTDLSRLVGRQDRVHLCRNLACTEEGGEHFTEYAVAKKFVPEKFQSAQAKQGAVAASKRLWDWVRPAGSKAVNTVVGRVKEFASESENEDNRCMAGTVTWKGEDGLQTLADSRCTAVGSQFREMLSEDLPVGSGSSSSHEVYLCSKHASMYLTKRFIHKCGVSDCMNLGSKFHSGVRMCSEHHPGRDRREEASSSSQRSRTRSRARSRGGEARVPVDANDADMEVDDEENGEAKVQGLLKSATEGRGETTSRPSRRNYSRSPGHTPKSNIQRNLARIEMMSSPGSEPEGRLLELFFEKYADGKQEGVKEDQVRSIIERERVVDKEDVLRRLIVEAQQEQAGGQRGLTRFIQKWQKELTIIERMKETPSDWSMVSGPSGAKSSPTLGNLGAVPPIPASFEEQEPPQRPSARPEEAQVKKEPTKKEQKTPTMKIAPPGIYKEDRRAGAETMRGGEEEPVAQIAKALQHQTAELASLVRSQAEGAGSQPAGTLKGLNRQSEELVFLMRACGQYDVKVGPEEHGQGLANALLAAQVGASTKLRLAGFRQKMSQRLAIGLAGPYWGVNDKYALSASDFVGYTDAELDQFASEVRGGKGAAEQRPPAPTRFDEWVARVRRQNDVWALVYGAEWKPVRNSALELLSEWHLSSPHKWPLNVVMDLWEELHWRCIEDFKVIIRDLKREIGRETLTLNEIKFHALMPGPDGNAWLVMPSTFDIERPGSWFQDEVLPRIERKQDRLLWNMTWQGGPKRDRPTQGPPPTAGGDGQDHEKPTIKALWGPKLSPEEVNRAKDRAPLDKNGVLLCWGNLCHVGCSSSNCQRSHEGLRGSFEALDPCVQMQFLKRGGLRRMRLETKDSVNLKIKDIRTKVDKDKAEKIGDGKRRGSKAGKTETEEAKTNQVDQADGESSTKAGECKQVQFQEVPEQFYVDYTQEEDVKQYIKGPDPTWGDTANKPTRTHLGRNGESAPEEARKLVQEAQALGRCPTLQRFEGASDDLYAWAAARVAREPQVEAIALLREMATYGLGETAREAAEMLEGEDTGKAGSQRLDVQEAKWDYASGGPGVGKVLIDGAAWTYYDYKEEVYMTEELASILKIPEPVKEKRQCVTLSLAAGVLLHEHAEVPGVAAAQREAQQLRLEQARQAVEAAGAMGEPEEMVAAVEHETRIYIHDIVQAHHEKDFRSLAVFPLQQLQEARLVVIRADFRGGLVIESIVGAQWQPGGWDLPVLIWKGHMMLLAPQTKEALEHLLEKEDHVSTPALGFTFFWHSRHDQPKTAPGQLHCRLCKPTRRAGQWVAQCRQHSCLAAVATMAGGEPKSQVWREVQPVATGEQPSVLVLQEVFAGTGRITKTWRKNGHAREPVEVFEQPHTQQGYKASHDLLQLENRERLLNDARKRAANVWWIAAPCTSYCDWQLENGGTRTFAQPEGTGAGPHKEKEAKGNLLSTFAAELFEAALDNGSFPICESSAMSGRYPKQWDLPAWRKVLSRPDVDFIEFPMCAFGLGPPDEHQFYVHRTRLVFPRHAPLRQVLLRPCPGVSATHRHVALKGARPGTAVTRCTEAGAYAWDFCNVVIAALQSSLCVGGGLVFQPQLQPEPSFRAGGKRGHGEEGRAKSEETSPTPELPEETCVLGTPIPEEARGEEEGGCEPEESSELCGTTGEGETEVEAEERSVKREDGEASESYTYTSVGENKEGTERKRRRLEEEAQSVPEEEFSYEPESPIPTPRSPPMTVYRAGRVRRDPPLTVYTEDRGAAGSSIVTIYKEGEVDPEPGEGADEAKEGEEESNLEDDESLQSIEHAAPDAFSYHDMFEEGAGLIGDRWEPLDYRPGSLHRVHMESRRKLFVPPAVGLPIPLDQLRNERRTIVQSYNGTIVTIDDDWRQAGERDIGYGEWIGHTIFTIQGQPTFQELFYGEQVVEGEESEEKTQDPMSGAESLQYSETAASSEHPTGASEGTNQRHAGGGDQPFHAPSEQAKLAAADYVKEVEESFENTEKGWSGVISKGNQLVTAAGGVREAAESLWEVREEQGLMNLAGVDSNDLDGVLHPDLLAYLREVRRSGMPARYVGDRRRVRAKLHPNAKRNVDQVFKQIAKDVKKHRALVVDGCLPQLSTTISSPFEAVDKMLPDRTISAEKRVVHDQRTVNAGTSKFWHPPALQPLHSQIARRILWCKVRAPGLPVLMSKKDIAGAFRLLWVTPEDVELFAGDLPWDTVKAFGHEPTIGKPVKEDITIIYLVSSFGFSGSPGEWTMWGRGTEELHRAYKPAEPRRDMSLGFDAKVLVDDCVLVEPWVGFRPWVSAEVFEAGVRQLLGDKAVNKEKDEVEGAFQTSQTVWGVIMETDTEKAALPERRVQKGAVLLSDAGFDYGCKDLTLKQLQQYRGIMTGWASIIPSLATELKAADKFLAGKDGSAPISINIKGDGSRRWEEEKAWEDLWELFEACRWLSARTDQWDLLFSTTLKEMLPPTERLSLPGEWKDVVYVSSDATPTCLGAIDWKHGFIFRVGVKELRPWITRVLTDQEQEAEIEDLIIHLSEMLSFIAFACSMAEKWQGKVIVYAGDNMVVKNWLQSRKSKVRGGRLLIRVLNMLEARWSFRVLAGWWRTYHNIDADFITRCSEAEYKLYKEEKGWTEVAVLEAVHRALEDSEKFGPCFLYGTDQEDRVVLLQLRERRMQRQVQKEVMIPWEDIRIVEWTAQGRLVKDFEEAAGQLHARLEGGDHDGPTLLCATLGVDSQGRQVQRVLSAAKTAKAELVVIEGPRAVAWELAERRCEQWSWGFARIEFVTTEFGEAMARRRQCMIVRPGGTLPAAWEEGLVRSGSAVPVRTLLGHKEWTDLVWKTPVRMQIESGIPRDRLLPNPVGHYYLEEDGERRTCHSLDGPCLWPKLQEDRKGIEDVLVFDHRGPPGCLRKLTYEEIWVLQGRSLSDLKKKEEPVRTAEDGCRATGGRTASSLLLWAGHILDQILEEDARRAGMCKEVSGPEALAQILVWLRQWKRGDYGRKAGGACVENYNDDKVYMVNRWAESWWISMLEDDSESEEEEESRRAGGRRSKKSPAEVAEKVASHVIDKIGTQVRPFCGEVRERVEEWLEENMTGDKSAATERAYAGAWAKWKAWSKRQGWLSEYLDRTEDAVERENKLLAYVGYLGWLGASVNTIRQNIFAIKTAHKRVGAGDITEGMHRIWILLGGLDRRSTSRKPRRLGVTQEMLVWLGQELIGPFKEGSTNPTYADAVMVFAALTTAWFYMLRAKEFAESNGVDKEMIVRGCDLRFATNGVATEGDAEEVTLRFRKTKADQLAFGDSKTLSATGRPFLCPVKALTTMKKVWPCRFQAGHSESQLPLFRWSSGAVLKRTEIQLFLQKAAEGVGLPSERFLSHSLRIGGATALYQATGDIELVKRLGRWTSSSVHRYLEDGGTISNSSRKMADVQIQHQDGGVGAKWHQPCKDGASSYNFNNSGVQRRQKKEVAASAQSHTKVGT